MLDLILILLLTSSLADCFVIVFLRCWGWGCWRDWEKEGEARDCETVCVEVRVCACVDAGDGEG